MHRLTWCLLGALCACGAPQSDFDFHLSGSLSQHVSGTADGSIDDGGFLSLDNHAWHVQMAIGGVAAGTHSGVSLSLLDETTGDLFTTTVAGACNVELSAHDASNGSTIDGIFYCTGLASSTGAVVDVNGGHFATWLHTATNPGPPLGP